MKKTKAKQRIMQAFMLLGVFGLLTMVACSDDDDPILEDPIASFEYTIDDENFLMVSFENFSLNATSYHWDFDDGETSTEENPTHIYDEVGSYEVILTATNEDGVSATFSESFQLTDPHEALALLAGETSKTWDLYRIETSMGVGPDEEDARDYWALYNDGSRPCVYFHTFTFNRDGEFIFDDNGSFWGEEAIFDGTDVIGKCFDATAENMVNSNGDDVSAWLSGTHAYTYEPSTSQITLEGQGAWMGMPQLGTSGESIVPEDSRTFNAVIEEHDGFDLLIISYEYADLYWDFTYANWEDPSMRPDVETEVEEVEELDPITPDEMFITFAARDAANMELLDTVASGSTVEFGVEDPLDDTASDVGKFIRTGGVEWQELQMRTSPEFYNIQFDNFDVAKIDIYVPADTEFNDLQRHFVFGFADVHTSAEWWNNPVQFVMEDDEVILGEWHTYEFDLTDVKEREDLDMIYLGIGGGGHTEEGIFYVRNLIFE